MGRYDLFESRIQQCTVNPPNQFITGPDDPQNPQNWPKSKKYLVTVLYSLLTFTLTFSSSIFSTATEATSKEFGVSTEVMTLGTSLIVLVRPTLFKPSEPPTVPIRGTLSLTFAPSGFRRRSYGLGSPQYVLHSLSPPPQPYSPPSKQLTRFFLSHRRTLRPQAPPLHRLLHLRDIPNPRRRRPQRRNNHALPLPTRRLRRLNHGRHRRRPRRLLGPRRARPRTRPVHGRGIHRPSRRPDRRRVHRHEPEPRLAMDGIYDVHPSDALLAHRAHALQRELRARHPAAESEPAPLRDEELGASRSGR